MIVNTFYIIVLFCALSAITASSGLAKVTFDQKDNLYYVKNPSEADYEKVARIISKFSATNKTDLLFLGESHHNSAIKIAQTKINEYLSNEQGFDCLSLEGANSDLAKPLFFSLTARKIKQESWIKIYQSYWKWMCELLDERFNYNGKCYNERVFSAQAIFLWTISRTSNVKFFGHEMNSVDFHNSIYDMRFNDPERRLYKPYISPKRWKTHFVLRNQEHTKNIVANFRAGKCNKMIIIAGSGHLDDDASFRQYELHPETENKEDFKKWPKIQPINETVSQSLGLKSTFVRLNEPNAVTPDQNKADITFVFIK